MDDSVDLRERVVLTVKAGLSRRTAARRFEVSIGFVIKLVQHWNRHGTVEPERYGTRSALMVGCHSFECFGSGDQKSTG